MTHYLFRGGEMLCENVHLSRVAEEVGTPVYVYSTAELRDNFTEFRDAFSSHAPLIAYAVKANSNLSVLNTLATMGAGADTVSEGEIRRAMSAGISNSKIVFSGVGKSIAELRFVLQTGIHQINVESEPELNLLAELAAAENVRPSIAIRVNPDVAAGSHLKISTGRVENKFGVSIREAERLYERASAIPTLRVVGLACHIGSQITSLAPFEAAFQRMRDLVERLRMRGLQVDRLDLGGGLGVEYYNGVEPPSFADFAAIVDDAVRGLNVQLILEPGRCICGTAGVLLSRVIHIHKRPEGKQFLVLDAAMNDLIRPALYEAEHEIVPVQEGGGRQAGYDVVGPVCETGDTFARHRDLPELSPGEIVVFTCAGAYGASMASEYNTRPLVPEVIVDDERFAVVRDRPTYDEMLAREPLAPWLQAAREIEARPLLIQRRSAPVAKRLKIYQG